MKLAKLNPKHLFRGTKKTRSITRSAPSSMSSSSSSSSSLTNPTTPKSVLPSRRELELLLTRMGPDPVSEEELTTMLMDQEIEEEVLIEKLGEVKSVDEIRDAFDYFDADKDGKISAEELLEVFVSMGDRVCTLEDCRRMIAGVDSDGDGFVCFQDFSRMMMMEFKFQHSN